jgi:acyl-CoA thioesterase I
MLARVRPNRVAPLLCLALVTATPLAAEEAVQPPAVTWDCRVPSSKMAAPAPLPHFAEVLTRKTTIDIVAIGSSSTFGIGASTVDRTYPVQLQGILEKTFKGRDFYISNSGTSGEVAAETAKRVRNEVTLKRPDLVLWQVGTNDVLAGVPLQEFRDTVLSTIRWLKEHQIDVVLIDLQYSPATDKDARNKAFEQVIAEAAAAENVLLVRRYDAMRFLALTKWEGLVSGDGLHQNDLGYSCMAEHVAHAVVASAFSRGPSAAPKIEEAGRLPAQ